jgi:hypothetical protein
MSSTVAENILANFTTVEGICLEYWNFKGPDDKVIYWSQLDECLQHEELKDKIDQISIIPTNVMNYYQQLKQNSVPKDDWSKISIKRVVIRVFCDPKLIPNSTYADNIISVGDALHHFGSWEAILQRIQDDSNQMNLSEKEGSDGKNLVVIESPVPKKEIKMKRKSAAIDVISDNTTQNKEMKKEEEEKEVLKIGILIYSWEEGSEPILKQAIQNIAENKKVKLFLVKGLCGSKWLIQFLEKEHLDFERLQPFSIVNDVINKVDALIIALSETSKQTGHDAILQTRRLKKRVEIIVDSKSPLTCRDCSRHVLKIDGKNWMEQFPLYHCCFCFACCVTRNEHKTEAKEYNDNRNSRVVVDDDGDASRIYPLPKSISNLDCSNCKTDRYCSRYYKVVHLLDKNSDVEEGFEIMCNQCIKDFDGFEDEESDEEDSDEEEEEEENSDENDEEQSEEEEDADIADE